MTIYQGLISHKNGLGRTQEVIATDDAELARAFGKTGEIGNRYSNGKVGMLKLEGSARHDEVAVDKDDVSVLNAKDYLKNNTSNIQDFVALAESDALHDDIMFELNRLAPGRSIASLSNAAQSALVRFSLGMLDYQQVRAYIDKDDPNQGLHDMISRTTAKVFKELSGHVAGIDYTISGKGTSVVEVLSSKVVINLKFMGQVSGSASSAGSAFKSAFVNVKNEVTNINKRESQQRLELVFERNSVKEDEQAFLDVVHGEVAAQVEAILVKENQYIDAKFADLEDFNPASTKSKLWALLGLTKSDVPDGGQNPELLRQYANGEITPIQYANDPSNGLIQKLTTAIQNRLRKADFSAIAEQTIDENYPTAEGEKRTWLVSEATKIIQLAVERLADTIQPRNFNEALMLYRQRNNEFVSQIKSIAMPDIARLAEISNETDNQDIIGLFEQKMKNYLSTAISVGIATYNIKDGNLDNYLEEMLSQEMTAGFKKWLPNQTETDANQLISDFLETFYPQSVIEQSILEEFDESALIQDISFDLAEELAETNPYDQIAETTWQYNIEQVLVSLTPEELLEVAKMNQSGLLDMTVKTLLPQWESLEEG